jgi:hypothetical protein
MYLCLVEVNQTSMPDQCNTEISCLLRWRYPGDRDTGRLKAIPNGAQEKEHKIREPEAILQPSLKLL